MIINYPDESEARIYVGTQNVQNYTLGSNELQLQHLSSLYEVHFSNPRYSEVLGVDALIDDPVDRARLAVSQILSGLTGNLRIRKRPFSTINVSCSH
jgi:hypothetical protein